MIQFFSHIPIYVYVIIFVVLGIGVIWACLKFKEARIFFGIFFTLVMVISAVYCGIQLNAYYKTKGGIKGALSGFFSNQVETKVEDEAEFSFHNMELTKTNDEIYTAYITQPNIVLKLDEGENYGVFINNEPCSDISYVGDYVYAKYTYAFYGEDFNPSLDEKNTPILVDSLEFRVAFYTDSIMIRVRSYGGEEAIKLWNYYFNRNTFILTVKGTDYKTNSEITYGEGDVPDYCEVSYVDEKHLTVTEKYLKGQTIDNAPNFYVPPKYGEKYFVGWSTDQQTPLNLQNFTVDRNTTLYSVYNTADAGIFESETGIIKYFLNEAQDKGLIEISDNKLTYYSDEIGPAFLRLKLVSELEDGVFENSNLIGIDLSASGIQTLPEKCFKNSSIETIIFPKFLERIMAECFSGCASLNDISDFPSRLRLICERAFEGCTSLNVIYIPKNVKFNIQGDGAKERSIFRSCSKDLIIGCELDQYPTTSWFTGWNYCDDTHELKTYWGYTLEGFKIAYRVGFKEFKVTFTYDDTVLETYNLPSGKPFTYYSLPGVAYWRTADGEVPDYVKSDIVLIAVFREQSESIWKFMIPFSYSFGEENYTFYSGMKNSGLMCYSQKEDKIYLLSREDGRYAMLDSYHNFIIIYNQNNGARNYIEAGDFIFDYNQSPKLITVKTTMQKYSLTYTGKIVYLDSSQGVKTYDIFTGKTQSYYTNYKWDSMKYSQFDGTAGYHKAIEVYSSSLPEQYLKYHVETDSFTLEKIDEGEPPVIIH